MTNGMRTLEKYVQQYIRENPGTENLEMECISEGTVKVTDDNGVHKGTMNLFCDIMDADTKKIIAESNIPHNLDEVGFSLATKWKQIPQEQNMKVNKKHNAHNRCR